MTSWLEEVINAIKELGGTATIQELYKYIEEHTNRELKSTWKSSVRKNIEHYSIDSRAYLGKESFFTSVNGIGSGLWRLTEGQDPQTPKSPDLDITDQIFSNPARKFIEIYRIQRDTKIIKELKVLYNNRCQVCRLSIKLKNNTYSEGHHIRPLGEPHSGPDMKGNVIILCPNHHVEFDYGMIAINPVTQTLIHKNLKNNFNGKQIYSKHVIKDEFNFYHLENIFKPVELEL